jgi:hypothetical protein
MRRLYILIGGSDDQNGDYTAIHRVARDGGTASWSSLKDAGPGDRALSYVGQPHSALVAKAEILARPIKGEPGDYAYRARMGRFALLPHRLSLDELKRAFPRWAWLRYPRGKAVVPPEYADRLWGFAHGRGPCVQILISNATHGRRQLEALASTGRSMVWSAPKLTAKGDTVLFYVERPISAIVAAGKALSNARPGTHKWYEARVGQVRWLDSPIRLPELRRLFPDWAWLRSVNMFAYVSEDRARALRSRVKAGEAGTPDLPEGRHGGGGFGDAETNAWVAKAAVRRVTGLLRRRGYTVRSRETENLGYDLDAVKGARTELHVEVKGVTGSEVRFVITAGEVKRARSDPAFRLMVVTEATRPSRARVHEYLGRDLKRRFVLKTVSYLARLK